MRIKDKKDTVLVGKYINMREITLEDAQFVLDLRCDEKKSRYISKVENNLQKQIDYIKRYFTLEDELYYIIEDKNHNPIGTNRIYTYPLLSDDWVDKKNTNKGILGPGSWLLKDGVSPFAGLESDYLLKEFFFETLDLQLHPMMIHKDNKNVLKHQQSWGAKIIGYSEDIQHHLLNLTKDDYLKNKDKFKRFIYR